MKLSLPPIDGFLSFTHPLNANVLFGRFFFESHPAYDEVQGSGAGFVFLYGLTLFSEESWGAFANFSQVGNLLQDPTRCKSRLVIDN